MKKIEELTAEQEARMPEFREKWIAIGLDTKRANRSSAENWCRKAYEAAGLKPPKFIFWAQSPLSLLLTAKLIKELAAKGLPPYAAEGSKNVRDGVWDGVWDGVGDGVRDSVRNSVWAGVGDGVRDGVWDGVWDGVRDGVRDGVWAGVRNSVRAGVGDGVRNSVGVGNLKKEWSECYSWGQHDADWLAFYDYLREVVGLREITSKLVPMTELAKETGWHLFYKNIAILTEKPTEVHLNGRHRLHNFNGPSIKWADGFEFFHFNNIRVSKELAEIPADKITSEMLTREANADIRREMIRKVGNERLPSLLKYEVIDRFEEYELITFDIGDGRMRPHLSMKCPSTGLAHILGSRPEQRSALAALAFLFDQGKYRRPIKEDGLDRGGDPADFEDGQTLYRHGDVHFKKYSGPLGDLKPIQTIGVLHAGRNNDHAYSSGEFEIRNVDGKKILVVHKESMIDHNEHGRQTHPPGNYEIKIACEYDHWLEESRHVID